MLVYAYNSPVKVEIPDRGRNLRFYPSPVHLVGISPITLPKPSQREDREKLLGIHIFYVIFGAPKTYLWLLGVAALIVI